MTRNRFVGYCNDIAGQDDVVDLDQVFLLPSIFHKWHCRGATSPFRTVDGLFGGQYLRRADQFLLASIAYSFEDPESNLFPAAKLKDCWWLLMRKGVQYLVSKGVDIGHLL